MLEIGAVRHDNYTQDWIENDPIDLHSQHPAIRQQDFFDMPVGAYDVVSCSLVLNFVGDPTARGESLIGPTDPGRMLRLIHDQLEPKSTSLLFLVLPLPCVANSRYLDRSALIDIMASVGFELLRERAKPRGKVGYWLWGWRRGRNMEYRKKVLHEGRRRNNFAITLSPDPSA